MNLQNLHNLEKKKRKNTTNRTCSLVSPMSLLFFCCCFVPISFWFSLCLRCLSAVLLKAMQQWFPPIVLPKGDRKTSQWKKGRWGNCWHSCCVKGRHNNFCLCVKKKKNPAAYLGSRKTRQINTWRKTKSWADNKGVSHKQKLTWSCDQSSTAIGLTFICATTTSCIFLQLVIYT